MDASPRTFRAAPSPAHAPDRSINLSSQWLAIEEAAAAIARIAGVSAETPRRGDRDLVALVDRASTWQAALARNHVTDTSAMMQSGLSALLSLEAHGRDGSIPAMALWQEYLAARAAVRSLVAEPTQKLPETVPATTIQT